MVNNLLAEWIEVRQNTWGPPEDIILELACIAGAYAGTEPLYAAVWATYWIQRAGCALNLDAAKGLADGQLEIDLTNCQNTLMAACDND